MTDALPQVEIPSAPPSAPIELPTNPSVAKVVEKSPQHKWMVENKVIADQEGYEPAICQEEVTVTRCKITGSAHEGDHTCMRAVNDMALEMMAKIKEISRGEAINQLMKGIENLDKWRGKVANKYGFTLKNKSFLAAQHIFD